MPALEAMQFDTIKLILGVAPWCVFSNYMHEFLVHTGQVIGMLIAKFYLLTVSCLICFFLLKP